MEFFYGGNGAEEMAVDGDGDLRRGRTGDDGDDPETKAGGSSGARARNVWRNFQPYDSLGYIYPSAVGVTEL